MKKVIWLLIFACVCRDASAYELGTHARMTYSAFALAGNAIVPRIADMGLEHGYRQNLGQTYIDVNQSFMSERSVKSYDWNDEKFPTIEDFDPSTTRPWAIGWAMSGAVREDDGSFFIGGPANWIRLRNNEPLDDPWGADFNRFCNHFIDPQHNLRAFTGVCGTDPRLNAAQWAIGTPDPWSTTMLEDTARRNHFTVYDARESMWRALTGLTRERQVIASSQADRNKYWATMFRSLGDIVHLLQDAGQPQHTRDEAHGIGPASRFEKYVEYRAKGTSGMLTDWSSPRKSTLAPLDFDSYMVVPRFASYGAYWTNSADGTGIAIAAGSGVADYSSRGFFTTARNIGNAEYALPSSDRCSYAKTPIVGSNLFVDEYLSGPVLDSLKATSDRIRMTRHSLWGDEVANDDSECLLAQATKQYSLDDEIFSDQANLLIPRAVAYSAGLLNYFFRGEMSITASDEGVYAMVDHSVENAKDIDGFPTIKLKLSNATPDDEMTGGIVVAILRFKRDMCYEADLSGVPTSGDEAFSCRSPEPEITVSEPVALPTGLGRAPTEFSFSFARKLPINATDVQLQVVYRGVLGNEADAMAVAAKNISEPTYFAYHNATDYTRIGDHVYTRAEINASPQLLAQVSPQSCVDWSVSPPQLVSQCLQPRAINLVLGTGTLPKTAIIAGLPARRFARIALLADGVTTALNQLSYLCLPGDPFVINNMQWQLETDAATGSQLFRYPSFRMLRGINGWVQASCVNIGDGVVSTNADDREARMDVLTDNSPYPTQILPL